MTSREEGQALAFADRPAEYASFRQSSKINISLTITKIAKDKFAITYTIYIIYTGCQGSLRVPPFDIWMCFGYLTLLTEPI